MPESSWVDVEYFDERWKERIKHMVALFPAPQDNSGLTIADFGCGEMWLKEFCPSNTNYIGVDYKKRAADTITVDFNKYEFPDIEADIAFVSGCLEYIEDPEWFIKKIAGMCQTIVMSYSSMEHSPDLQFREVRMWKNHLYCNELIEIVEKNGFVLLEHGISIKNTQIFRFDKQQRTE